VCGRFTLAAPDGWSLRQRFPLGESVELRQRFNVAPGDDVAAVTTDRHGAPRGELLRWGLVPFWAKDPSIGYRTINARAETVAERPAFRDAFRSHRCLIVADGFYEWQRRPGLAKQPHHITRADGAPFAFAGLWSTWRPSEDGEQLRSCSIITTVANRSVAELHDRMPVILEQGSEDAWLDAATPAAALRELLVPLPADAVAMRPVSSAVNDARHDEPDCLADPEPGSADEQLRLLDDDG
jgi:putative SOS response-associated peptidase YedK